MSENSNCEQEQSTAQATAIQTIAELASKNMTMDKATSFMTAVTILLETQKDNTIITSIANSVETAINNFIIESGDEPKNAEFISLVENFLNTFGSAIQNQSNTTTTNQPNRRRLSTVNQAQCSLLSIAEKTVNKYLYASSDSLVPGEIFTLQSNIISGIAGNFGWKDS